MLASNINGQTVGLLLDTGGEKSFLTEAAVERLHIPRDARFNTPIIGVGAGSARVVTGTASCRPPNSIGTCATLTRSHPDPCAQAANPSGRNQRATRSQTDGLQRLRLCWGPGAKSPGLLHDVPSALD
jgi:Aspartyl protease